MIKNRIRKNRVFLAATTLILSILLFIFILLLNECMTSKTYYKVIWKIPYKVCVMEKR